MAQVTVALEADIPTATTSDAGLMSAADKTKLDGIGPGPSGLIIPPQGRLTLTTNTPVLTGAATAQSTVFFTPYRGTFCPVFDGANWVMIDFTSELSLALDANSGHTGYQQSGKNFDVFYANVSGLFYFGTGPAWTSDTARSAALTRLKGILVNNATMTLRHGSASGNTVSVPANQATYLGTMRATADGQTGFNPGGAASGGTAGLLGLWNYYNRVRIGFEVKKHRR